MNKKNKELSRREKNKKNNRSIIIKAGIDIFLEKGISQTTVRDIIRSTDLASGTFYNYFKSKEEVLIEPNVFSRNSTVFPSLPDVE